MRGCEVSSVRGILFVTLALVGGCSTPDASLGVDLATHTDTAVDIDTADAQVAMDVGDIPQTDTSTADSGDDVQDSSIDQLDSHEDASKLDAATVDAEVLSDDATDVGPDAATTAPLPNELAGRIHVIQGMTDGVATTSFVQVELFAGPLPTSQAVVKEEGDCKLLVGGITMPWACDPECEWGVALCIDGACVPYPAAAPSGTVTLGGLSQAVALEPNEMGTYPGEWGLPAELFAPGVAVTATSTGGATPALSLGAKGVEPLVAHPDAWHLVPGEDYAVTWTPGTGEARIQLLVQTGWHGSPNLTTILCETDDDGEVVVPASLTADFPIPSCGECEGSTLTRFTRDVVDHGSGPIELLVGSQVWFVAWWGGG